MIQDPVFKQFQDSMGKVSGRVFFFLSVARLGEEISNHLTWVGCSDSLVRKPSYTTTVMGRDPTKMGPEKPAINGVISPL